MAFECSDVEAMMEEERPPAEEGDAGRLMAEVDHLCVLTLLVGVKQLQHAAEYKSVVAETEVFCSKAEGKQAAPTGAPELREFDINALEAEVDGLLVATEVPADKETRTPLTTAVRAIKTVGDGVLSSRLNLTEAKVPASQPPEEVVKGVLCLSPTTQSRMELDLSRAVARKKAAESALRSRKILTLLRAEHMHSLREGFRPLVRIRAEAVAIETALQRPPGSSGVDGMTSAIWPGGDDLLPTCEPSRTGACSALLVAEERRGRPMIGVLIDAAESAEGQDEQSKFGMSVPPLIPARKGKLCAVTRVCTTVEVGSDVVVDQSPNAELELALSGANDRLSDHASVERMVAPMWGLMQQWRGSLINVALTQVQTYATASAGEWDIPDAPPGGFTLGSATHGSAKREREIQEVVTVFRTLDSRDRGHFLTWLGRVRRKVDDGLAAVLAKDEEKALKGMAVGEGNEENDAKIGVYLPAPPRDADGADGGGETNAPFVFGSEASFFSSSVTLGVEGAPVGAGEAAGNTSTSGRVRSPMPQTSGKKIGGQGQAGSARSQFFIDQLRSSIEGDDTVTPGRPFPTKGYLVKEDTGGSVDKPCPTGGARKGGEGQEGKEISGNPKSEGNGGKGKSGKNKKKKSRGKGGKKKRGGR